MQTFLHICSVDSSISDKHIFSGYYFLCLALLSHILLCLSQWHAFSVPELQNFLIILEKEEKERMRQVEQRYAAYREKLLQALCKVEGKPG